ncbi:MAG: 4-hydroxythreonine-4-phosphate dehydrogenase PdxA, partial [Gammaproteobacteria bacterium]
MKKIPRILITPGEPAGIGPELLVRLAQESFNAELIVVGSSEVLKNFTAILNLPLEFTTYDSHQPAEMHKPSLLKIIDIDCPKPNVCGTPAIENVPYLIDTLTTAAQKCLSNECQAVVTGPIEKSIINQAGIVFPGHTEFFADLANTKEVLMMLTTKGLRVALVTTHLPLNQVSQAITKERLTKTIEIILATFPSYYGIQSPNILVCGLNPHAGENGHLGTEEITVIKPVLEQFSQNGIQISGPLAADTTFTKKYIEQADVIIAMYHDQGLPVLKYMRFGHAVNITLGLPFIRTSDDHGTAYDLAGK